MKHLKNLLLVALIALAGLAPRTASAIPRWILLGETTVANASLVAGVYAAEVVSPKYALECTGVRATLEGTMNPSTAGTISIRANEYTLKGNVIFDAANMSRIVVLSGAAAVDAGAKNFLMIVESFPGDTVGTATLDTAGDFRIWKTFAYAPFDKVALHVDISIGATGTITGTGLTARLWGYCER